jgi:hypothetical protein
MITYETKLDRDFDWALREGSTHFEGNSAVHKTLQRITKRLDELGIDYAIAGGMAMFFHGYRRFTEGVDILVTSESLARIHEELEGRGYIKPFETSKNLRDAESRVRIDFIVTGQYPGSGKPGPIAFPDPKEVAEIRDGVRVVSLPVLVELKLASGKNHRGARTSATRRNLSRSSSYRFCFARKSIPPLEASSISYGAKSSQLI